MAYQVPKDLIERARILLRKEAGLESYNPSDSSLPILPTVEEVVAGFDPSPDSLRCKHCKGKLLRGSQSVICVFCGREQKLELPPEPMSFKSTIGFRWLVDSLGLDGSEIVEPSDEDTQIKRGWNSVKDEITLSNFLDLEMKWPAESERFGLTDADELKNKGKTLLQLAGVDLNSSSEVKSENSLSLPIEQTISNEKSVDFEAFPVRGSLGLSENREFSGGVTKPSEGENGDSFSGWEADFQAASYVAPHEDLKSSHPSQIPSVDYASHMDSVFGPLKDFNEEGKSVNDSFSDVPYSIKETETDGRNNSYSGASALEGKDDVNVVSDHGGKVSEPSLSSVSANWLPENEQQGRSLESVDNVKGVRDDSSDSWKNFSSATDMENDQWLPSSTVVSNSAKIGRNSDSSDVWNDFTGSNGSGDNQHQTSRINASKDDDSFDAWNDFTGSVILSDGQLASRGVNSAEEMSISMGNDVFGSWGDVNSLTSAQGSQHEASGEIAVLRETVKPKDSVGLFSASLSEQGDKLQNEGTLSNADKITKKDEDSFNMWGGFLISTVAQHSPGENNSVKLTVGQLNGEGDDTADRWGDFMSLTNSGSSEQKIKSAEIDGDKKIVKDDDSLDSWNFFTNLAYKSESKSISEDTARVLSDISNPSIHQTIDQQAPGDRATVEDDDSFNSWSEFRSSSNAVSNKIPSPAVASVNNISNESFSSQAWSDFTSSMFQARQEHTSGNNVSENDIVKDDDVFNSWGGFRGSSVSQSNQLQNSEARMSQADGFFNGWSSGLASSKGAVDNQLRMGGTSVPDLTTTSGNYDSFDAWSDFTSSTNLSGNQLQNIKESQVDDKHAVTQDDPFDAWSLLMSSSSSQSNDKDVSSSEYVYETSLLNSSGDLKTAGINSTLQTVSFPDAATDQNGSANLGISSSEVLDSFRLKDGNVNSGIHAEQTQRDEHGSVQASGEKPIDAETLISQMHDLSFMLESGLSIPRKVD